MAQAQENPGYVDSKYLEILAERLKPIKERSYEFMHLEVGHRVLDVGCGPGTDTISISQLVGSTGIVHGIDYDVEMIEKADQRAREAGVADRIMHRHGDAISLPYESNYFHSCRSERLFQHLSQPQRVLSEMFRVTRPGGWIVVLDSDHSSLSIDTDDVDIEWRLRRFHADRLLNGYSGRQLFGLFRQQKLADIAVECFPVYITDYVLGRYMAVMDETEKKAIATGVVTEEELRKMHEKLWRADKEGTFFGYVVVIMTAGRKPWFQHQKS
jgi:ubiquinone/menaquinone biosynthesis C-methylase UbiE